MKFHRFSSERALEIRARVQNPKAPEGWRSPKRFARNRRTAQRASVLECGGPPPLFRRAAVAAMILLLTLGAGAQTTNILSDAEIQGRNLAQQLCEARPAENFTNTGVLQIRDGNGNRTNISMTFDVRVSPKHWTSSYVCSEMNYWQEALNVIHTKNQTNVYIHTATGVASVATLPDAYDSPFANSDFWIGDFGLEFFHWPGQKILKKEFARGRGCMVLESTNPDPSTNNYSRVVSWIDEETLGIVHAEAYDARGKLLKVFDPKSFKKVNGQWELQDMEIRNVQTKSRTRIEFKLGATNSPQK
jgi:hypothetical protein